MNKSPLRDLYASGLVKAPPLVLLALLPNYCAGMLIGEIADQLGVSNPTASMAINTLARCGMLERRYPFRDQRQVSVHLTEKGKQEAVRMRDALAAV
jgi:DNA-binding MarR family transcriptional regulator